MDTVQGKSSTRVKRAEQKALPYPAPGVLAATGQVRKHPGGSVTKEDQKEKSRYTSGSCHKSGRKNIF